MTKKEKAGLNHLMHRIYNHVDGLCTQNGWISECDECWLDFKTKHRQHIVDEFLKCKGFKITPASFPLKRMMGKYGKKNPNFDFEKNSFNLSVGGVI